VRRRAAQAGILLACSQAGFASLTDAASVLIAVSRAGASTGIITGVAGGAGVLTTLSITGGAGVLICAGLPCADGRAGLAGVGYIPTPSEWRSFHQTPAVAKPHIEVKVIVMAHGVFLLKYSRR
jgi:hypothetical protein